MKGRCVVFSMGVLIALLFAACGGAPGPTAAPQPAELFRTTPAVVATPASVVTPVPLLSPMGTLSAGRPILYFAGETIESTRGFFTRGVYLDGRPWLPGLPASGAAWSPAGTRLAYIDAANPDVLQVLIRTGASHPVFAVLEGERLVPWPSWAPDGIRVAVLIRREDRASGPASLAVIAIPAAQLLSRYDLPAETVRLPGRTKPLNAFDWSADGQRILVAWENAIVLDSRDGKITSVTPGFAIAEWAATDNAVLYFTVEGGSFGGFYRRSLDGASTVELASRDQVAALDLRPMKDSFGLMHLSPDRRRLAVASGTDQPGVSAVRIYDVSACVSRCPDLAAPSAVYSAAGDIAALEWASDGTALAAVAVLPKGAALQVLDLQTGLWRSPLPGPILQVDELPVLGYIRVLSWDGG